LRKLDRFLQKCEFLPGPMPKTDWQRFISNAFRTNEARLIELAAFR
jgi:hypothetical protein